MTQPDTNPQLDAARARFLRVLTMSNVLQLPDGDPHLGLNLDPAEFPQIPRQERFAPDIAPMQELITDVSRAHADVQEEMEQLRSFIVQVNDGREFDLMVVTEETQWLMATAAGALLEIAKRVAWAHVEMKWADWLVWVEERLGLSQRSAYNYVTAAKKMAAANLTKSSKLFGLKPGKLLDLCNSLEPEELRILEDGGTVRDLTLDRIDGMGSREMRGALRKTVKTIEKLTTKLEESEKVRDELEQRIGGVLAGSERSTVQRLGLLSSEVDAAFRKTSRLIEDIPWTTASTTVRARTAALLELMRSHFRAVQEQLDAVLPFTPEVVRPDGQAVVLGEDAQVLLDRWRSLEGRVDGEVLRLDEIQVEGWQRPRVAAAVAELESHGFVVRGDTAGEYAFRGEIGAVLDVPEWLRAKGTPDAAPANVIDLNGRKS